MPKPSIFTGTFYPSIESTGATSVVGYDPLVNIVGVHLNFRPEAAGGADEKLTSRSLKEQCTFKMNDYVTVKHKTVDGKDVTYQERIPLSQYGISQADPDPEP